MSLLADMTPPARKASQCKMWMLRDGLDAGDQKILDVALADTESWPTETLTRELRRRGLQIGRETIRAHRKGDCACARQ